MRHHQIIALRFLGLMAFLVLAASFAGWISTGVLLICTAFFLVGLLVGRR